MPPAPKARRRWLSPLLLMLAICGFAILQFGIDSHGSPLLKTPLFVMVTVGNGVVTLWAYKAGFYR
ncbi:MAG TPA: hypothetical protein VGN12_19935 [Pirellulales bacterium]